MTIATIIPAESFAISTMALTYDGSGRTFPVQRIDADDDTLDIGWSPELGILQVSVLDPNGATLSTVEVDMQAIMVRATGHARSQAEQVLRRRKLAAKLPPPPDIDDIDGDDSVDNY